MTNPSVSVVIPTHNRPEMLAEALASVRRQTFTDYEVIVVSNGETIRNRNKSSTVAALCDARYFALDAGNLAAARNFGTSKARGTWIAFLDDDDAWLPAKLDLQLADANRTGADMISCDYIEFYPDGREIAQRPRLSAGWTYTKAASCLDGGWWAAPSCVLIRKAILDQTGGFDLSQRFGEDNDLWRRVSWRYSIHQVPDALVRYRRGHAKLTYQRRRMLLYEVRHFAKMHFDTPTDLRSALPRAADFVLPRLAEVAIPKLLRQPFHPARLRRHWKTFKSWVT
jgi:glycosyltransferase involved in cell wall biosynthesis